MSFSVETLKLIKMNITRSLKAVLLICLLVLGLSFFFVNKLPLKTEILKELYTEPIQIETKDAPFTITRKGITYTITPLFSYEMYGLVVSYHDSNSWIDISHDGWKDYLNTKDISTIWGYDIETGSYLDMHFYHGDWTGYYKYSGQVDFRNNCFGNAHLLANDEGIEKRIMNTRTGDQVYAKGYLVKYSHSNEKFVRSSSIVRDDTGNGACEIIYVTDYKVLKSANQSWKLLRTISLYLGIICIMALMYSFFYY